MVSRFDMRRLAVKRCANFCSTIDSGYTRIARVFLLAFVAALLWQCAPANQQSTLSGSVVAVHTPSLPDGCAIVATEATARLKRAGCWTRILYIDAIDPVTSRHIQHDLAVWQPLTARRIHIYDQLLVNASADLKTESRDALEIARTFAQWRNLVLIEAHFIE